MATPQTPISTPAKPLNFTNIQGDIVLGLPKREEEFIFFQIVDVNAFRKCLPSAVRFVTSMSQVMSDHQKIADHKKTAQKGSLLPLIGTNIAFSALGLTKLGVKVNDLGDPIFAAGQQADAPALNDRVFTTSDGKVIPNWDSTFLQPLDGVILIAGYSGEGIKKRRGEIESVFAKSIKPVDRMKGKVRPGDEKGHEHFGFMDGISQPAISGLGTPNKGQDVIPPGIIILGNDGDPVQQRPAFAKDGSFLVFRKLRQYVPEFDSFLLQNGQFPGLTPRQGADFLGARLVGRWKSGAPIDLTPLKDDKVIADDLQKNNAFRFTETNPDDKTDQTRCPFAAHVRKTNPRGDLDTVGGTTIRRIMRQGIPYGPEVGDEEHELKRTHHDRGLAFVCYQSVLSNGFHFMQQSWANNTNFIFGKPTPPGFDPIIGQNGINPRSMTGFDASSQSKSLALPDEFVESRGGEYFFSPSISALKNVFGTV